MIKVSNNRSPIHSHDLDHVHEKTGSRKLYDLRRPLSSFLSVVVISLLHLDMIIGIESEPSEDFSINCLHEEADS